MKFGTVTHIASYSGPTVNILNFSKIQDGGGRHLENNKKRDIFSMDFPIFTKFGTVGQNRSLRRCDR